MEEMTISEIVGRLRAVREGALLISGDYEALTQAADILEKLAEITAESARRGLNQDWTKNYWGL